MEDLILTLKQQIIDALNLEGVTPEDIDDDAPLFGDGLGLDSIDALEIIVILDKYYGINKVRERARESTVVGECKIANLDDTNVTGDFLDIILQERLWELNCEGHRRWDLIRIGRLKETMTAFWQTQGVPEMDNCEIRPEHILFPMPQQEVDVNPNLVPAGETNNGYIISGDGDVEI